MFFSPPALARSNSFQTNLSNEFEFPLNSPDHEIETEYQQKNVVPAPR
jgi:hypothetical protein